MNAVRVVARKSLSIFPHCVMTLFFAAWTLQTTPAYAKDQKKITADYSINFNGLGIGSFKLWSDLNKDEYNIKSRAKISILAGILFEWNGTTASAGRLIADQPRPYTYSFGYRTSDKGENVDVEFANNNVKQIAVNPPQKQSSSRIPVTRSHMRNVVDPMSAVIMLTNVGSGKNGNQVCTRRLPIFDGKARYDIKLSLKKTKKITTAYGYDGPAHICKVKFVPIAGHKAKDDENDYAAKSEDIEIWMVPLSDADLYVPYYIYIPTPMGAATLTASGFLVETPGGERGALLQ